METKSLSATPAAAVRWPFRILAVLVVAAGIIATVGFAFSRAHEPALFRWQFVAGLPGLAWLVRFAWFAAVHGRSPVPEYWPFASQRVFTCYIVVWLIVLFA